MGTLFGRLNVSLNAMGVLGTNISFSRALWLSIPVIGLIESHRLLNNQMSPDDKQINRLKVRCPAPINGEEKQAILNQFRIEYLYNLTATASACLTVAGQIALLAIKTFSLSTRVGIWVGICVTLLSAAVTCIDAHQTSQDIRHTISLETVS